MPARPIPTQAMPMGLPMPTDPGFVIPAFSTPNDQIVTAMQAALAEMTVVHRDRTADMGNYSYSYADLGSVLDMCRPILAQHGLSLTQITGTDGVSTGFMHSSGQWCVYPPLRIPSRGNDAQSAGSAITYARRYSLLAALGIATEDDDGQAASREARPVRETAAMREARGIIERARALSDEQRAELREWSASRGHTPPGAADMLAELANDADWRQAFDAAVTAHEQGWDPD